MLPKKSLGQNFLKDQNILSKIVSHGEISNSDIILEIGPGTGLLTQKILDKSPNELIVVEKDKELSINLKKKFGNKIQIINKDILKCYSEFNLGVPIKVFGNLPYNISTQILTSFVKVENLEKNFLKFLFVFQKEVAERIVAEQNSKNYGRLSIFTSWKMNSSKIFDISPKNFYPIPKVWSTFLKLTPKSDYEKIKKSKNLEHITNIFFNQRRKMIKKPMKQIFKNYEAISNKLNLDLNLRPQNLSKKQYLILCKIYETLI
tara:strand:- start:682 stop:1464 length:783 start_codon:yes stop_codon:yes gene_type:complete